jgi:hypothetical protein
MSHRDCTTVPISTWIFLGHRPTTALPLMRRRNCRELAHRLRGTEVTVNAVHPGGIAAND